MKELTDKMGFFENLINKFAAERIENAYAEFEKQYDYDPRKSHDKIVFDKWSIGKDKICLTWREITPHDQPYSDDMNYPISKLRMSL